MASIQKRDGRFILHWRDPMGRQKSKSFDFERDAKEFRWTVEPMERRRLKPSLDPTVTVHDYALRWLKIAGQSVEASTLAGYTSALRVHVCGSTKDPEGGPLRAEKDGPMAGTRVSHLRKGHVKELLAGKLGEGLSPETVRRIGATLQAMLAWAVDDELLVENPAARVGRKLGLVRGARQRAEEVSPFTEEQRDLFHATANAKDATLAPLWFTIERAGLRLGEALALRLGDVNLKRREIRIEKSLSFHSREMKAPKAGFGRTVEIGSALHDLLSMVVPIRRKAGIAAGDANPLLFPSEAGTPYHHGNVERRFKKVVREAGLPTHHTPHDLRHTYATIMLEHGADIQWLQRQLGHASIQLTVDTYGKHRRQGATGQADLIDSRKAEKEKA